MQRWTILLAEFNFTVENISGEQNTLTDMLTRRAASGKEDSIARRMARFCVPLVIEETL